MSLQDTELGVQTTAELDGVLVALLGDDDDAAVRLAGAFADPPDEAGGVAEPGVLDDRLCGAPGADTNAGTTGRVGAPLSAANGP
jgi:hypothetical protein